MPRLIALVVVLAVACGLAASCTGRPDGLQAQGPGTATPTWTPWPWERTATAEAIDRQATAAAELADSAPSAAAARRATARALATQMPAGLATALVALPAVVAARPTPIPVDPRRLAADPTGYTGQYVALYGRAGRVVHDAGFTWFELLAETPANRSVTELVRVYLLERTDVLRGDCYLVPGIVAGVDRSANPLQGVRAALPAVIGIGAVPSRACR